MAVLPEEPEVIYPQPYTLPHFGERLVEAGLLTREELARAAALDRMAKSRAESNPSRFQPPSPQPRLGERLLQVGLVTEEQLSRALSLQEQTREPLGRILISLGFVRRYDLYRVLAEQWDLPFVDLLKEPPDPALARRFAPETLIQGKFMPVCRDATGLVVAVASRPDVALERLIRGELGAGPIHYRVTTEWDIDQVVRKLFRRELLDGAVYGLYYRSPSESAHSTMTHSQFCMLAGLLFGLLAGLYFIPAQTLVLLNLAINIAFMGNVLFRFVVSLVAAGNEHCETVTAEEVASLTDDSLPTYTVLVPVYREASVMKLLLRNLSALDYPAEKLDILVLLEEDDDETITAAKAANPPGNVQLVVVPNQAPKTKPKACNVGLYFARGEYLVIYDAEDRPDPDQLKKSVVAFRKGASNLVCVQTALNYFNARENFLTRMFTLEYSYWFDFMLPGLYRLGLPIPLGGTSNHFRTDMLRQLGGWDPFNVTEDADLGVRAATRGYTVGIVNSTTYEEANSASGNWIRQRSRWIKGYMQTSLVNLRNPSRLLRAIGAKQSLGFLLLVVGTPVSLLSAPIMWVLFFVWLVTGAQDLDFLFPPLIAYISLFNLLLGNAISIYTNMLAVFKRRYFDLTVWALVNPVYWVFHYIAAYKALRQLLTKPFFWEKTVHGISKEL
jgi:glycosyltransferase XagB